MRKGYKHTKEALKKMSAAKIGKKRLPFSAEYIQNLSNSKKGEKNPQWHKSPSKETLKKRSEAVKGEKNPFYGKHHSEEAVKKNRDAHIGKVPWNKGKTGIYSEETLKGNRNAHIGMQKGENHWNWQGGLTPLYRLIRNSFKYRQWRSDVFTRDRFQCQICLDKPGRGHNVIIEAHHCGKSFSKLLSEYGIKTLEEAINCEELWNINNGQTTCKKCHKKIHGKAYGL